MKRIVRFIFVLLGITFCLICVAPIVLVTLIRVVPDFDFGQCANAVTESQTTNLSNIHPTGTQKLSGVAALQQPLLPIDIANAGQVKELARFGRGYVRDAFWASNGDLLVFTSVGLWRHDHNQLDGTPQLLWSYYVGADRVTFSPDNSMWAIITTSHPKKLPVLSAESGKQLLNLDTEGDRGGAMAAVSFSPDRKFIAAAIGRNVHLWDIATGQERHIFVSEEWGVESLIFSPDSKWLAAGSSTITVWDIATKNVVAAIKAQESDSFSNLAFSPDGKYLASADRFFGKQVRLWSMPAGIKVNVWPKKTEYANSLAFNSTGTILVSTIELIDLQSGKVLGQVGDNYRAAFSPDDTKLAAVPGSSGGQLAIWDAKILKKTHAITSYDELLRARYMTISSDKTVLAHFNQPELNAVSPNGSWLAFVESRSSGSDSSLVVRLCNATAKRQIAVLTAGRPAVFSSDSTTLATGSGCDQIDLWGAATGQAKGSVGPCTTGQLDVTGIAFSTDNRIVAFATKDLYSDDTSLTLWDIQADRQIADLKGHTDAIYGLTFSADNTLLGSSSVDGTIRVWGIPK